MWRSRARFSRKGRRWRGGGGRRAAAWLAPALFLLGSLAPPVAPAKVFLSRTEALEWAFPDADAVTPRTHVLTEAQMARVEALAGNRPDSQLVTVYTGRRGDAVLGHAFLEMHVVRTQPEAFLVVVSPAGRVERLRMLAFHEPLEYLPPERWLAQFEGADDEAPLRVSRDIHGIAGSTLSAHAVTGGVRRALALHRILVRGEE